MEETAVVETVETYEGFTGEELKELRSLCEQAGGVEGLSLLVREDRFRRLNRKPAGWP